jgi:hypothetical protein
LHFELQFELQADESQADESQSQLDAGQPPLSQAETVGIGERVVGCGVSTVSFGAAAFWAAARVAVNNTAQVENIRTMKRFLSLDEHQDRERDKVENDRRCALPEQGRRSC